MFTHYVFELYHPAHPNTYKIIIEVTAAAITWKGSGTGFATRSGLVSFSQTAIRLSLASGFGTSSPFLTLRTPPMDKNGLDSWEPQKAGRCLNDNQMDSIQSAGKIPDKQDWRWRYLGKRET